MGQTMLLTPTCQAAALPTLVTNFDCMSAFTPQNGLWNLSPRF
jgi:hypothetical protein